MTARGLVLAAVLLSAACGKRLPPPPPAPNYSPDATRGPDGERGAEQGARRAAPAPVRSGPLDTGGEDLGPVDHILASPWTRHEGIEERVGWWYEYWQTRGRGTFERYLIRMGRYVDFVDQELAARGMPPSLRYLPVVEAGYYPPAVSPVGAGGLWQFMPPTARWLGLEVTTLVDERLDPYRATPTALEYLLSLNDQFGSWFLTLAAYNSGPGRIERLIRDYGEGRPRNDALYWHLRDRMPGETRDFVPKFLAAVRMGSAPHEFGFGHVVPDPAQAFDEVDVDGAVSLDVLAAAAAASEEVIEELNPHLVRGLTPGGRATRIRVPAGQAEEFRARLAAIPPDMRVTFTEHRVARNETLSHIAVMYGVPLRELRDANPSADPRRLRIGQRLTVPRRGSRAASVTATPAASPGGGESVVRAISDVPGRVHVVSSGESLWTIARGYGVTIGQLREWNGELSGNEVIHPGDQLRVQEPGSVTYTVQSGDTIWDIARTHGLSADRLLRYNGLSGRTVIRPGDQVQIPPPSPSTSD